MKLNEDMIQRLYDSLGHGIQCPTASDEAHIEIHHNKVLGAHLLPGLHVEPREFKDGVEAKIRLDEGVHIAKPVRICFGMLPEDGLQHVLLDVELADRAKASFIAYCTFPNARNVRHLMDARIRVGRDAEYKYFERHVHGPQGGVLVVPKAQIEIREGGRFKTEFELISGAVGEIDIDYNMDCQAHGVFEMLARISGRGNDKIKISESGRLLGEHARGVLTSHVALRDKARAEIYNKLTAEAAYARGHVDCKEIVQGEAVAKAIPIVEVNNPKAHVTHEAAIGSVDSKQLQSLMARGLNEDDAVDLIIRGMLS